MGAEAGLRALDQPYEPGDDSLLLADLVASRGPRGRLGLDIGTGCGIQLATLLGKCEYVVGTDLNSQALRLLLSRGFPRESFDLILCDRARPLREAVFDLVVFNPPYLPDQPGLRDPSVDGGPGGGEVPGLFLEEALRVVKPGGRVYFVLSSLTSLDGVKKASEAYGARIWLRAERHFLFERLQVYECERPGT